MYEKLLQLVLSKEISFYKLSKETGIAESLFTAWKSGRSKPKVDKLKILADYFDVPIDYFLE